MPLEPDVPSDRADHSGTASRRAAMALTGPRRDEVARILEIAIKDGFPGPRDLDVALDAIEQAYLHIDNTED
jgi:hypothetical protein